jgi:hypothetical protein
MKFEEVDAGIADNIKDTNRNISSIKMSKYEFCSAITTCANYINTLDSLSDYISEELEEAYGYDFINPCEIAYILLMTGKLDIILNRQGYDYVLFSKLKINPIWKNNLEAYFERSRKALRKSFDLYDVM